MLDIKHNGVEKKVNGSVKETDGLLIISGVAKWVSAKGGYTATFIDPRIKSTHVIQSIKSSSLSGHNTTDWTAEVIDVEDGFVSITLSEPTDQVITITMYDVAAVATPSGMSKSFTGEVSFTDWKVTETGTGAFSGTVAVKIEDDEESFFAASLATVVNNTFSLHSNAGSKTTIGINGIKEVLPDGRFVCNAYVEMEGIVLPTSVSDARISYVYIASDTIRIALPEATAEWTEYSPVEQEGSSGITFYEATFDADVPDSVRVTDVAIVRGENGEKFPAVDADTQIEEMPKMCSYIHLADGKPGPAQITVHWERDTAPETTKLTAEIYVANYETLPLHP